MKINVARVAPSLVGVAILGHVAHAQSVDRQYVEEPTDGLAMPLAPLAGEHDARTVVVNPGGLALVRGTELAVLLAIEDPDVATSSGPGVGGYAATVVGGGVFPRVAFGLGLEWLRPPAQRLMVDPGDPFRFTLGLASPLGKNAGLGVSWHHFSAEGLLDGADTFDVGMSTRWGRHLAVGGVVRDLTTRSIANIPVQRRYELEVVTRPLGTDALEVALGGRIGETRADVDGWARLTARLGRGVFAHLAAESRETHGIAEMTGAEVEGREARATFGLEISLGSFGMTASTTGLRDDRDGRHLLGGQILLRSSAVGPASVIGTPDHIERVELTGSIGLRELTGLVARLRAIARDPSAKALVVTFDGVSAGWATLEELRNEVVAVRAANKKVFAYLVSGTGRDYFIASAADKIYVDPAGGLRLVGMAGTSIYFKGAFDQFGVLPQFEKIAEYKSAPEQFTQKGPSDTARKMQNDLFDSLWDRWVTAVADGRKLQKSEVQALIDNGPYTAGDLARDKQLVDEVAAPEKVSQLVATEMGAILRVGSFAPGRPDRWTRPAIAVIYVDGDIVDGKSRSLPFIGQKLVGSETLVAAITAARADPKIGAIILRIDSPGGSALASELISREVFATRGVKPILCSLGDIAASGGYFIAAGCDLIFAEPTTLTGSIGIFYGKFEFSGLANKLGIAVEVYKRGKRADVESYFRPYSEEERAVLMDKLRYMYTRFIGAVAEGRGMSKEDVDKLGRGHVYTGEQARPIKLVDRFGGFGDALDEAKRRIAVAPGTRVQLVELPAQSSSLFGALGDLLGLRAVGSGDEAVSVTDLPAVKQLLRGVPPSVLVSPDGALARLPFDLSFD